MIVSGHIPITSDDGAILSLDSVCDRIFLVDRVIVLGDIVIVSGDRELLSVDTLE